MKTKSLPNIVPVCPGIMKALVIFITGLFCFQLPAQAQDICALNTSNGLINYCEAEPVAACGEQYFYYLPAVADITANNSQEPQSIRITTETALANVIIRRADGTIVATPAVNNTAIYTYSTSRATMFNAVFGTAINDRGYVIQSDQPITVRWTLDNQFNQAQVVLKGRNALGTAFRAMSALNTTTAGSSGPHFFTVMASQDNTKVQWRNAGTGTFTTVTLNKWQQLTIANNNTTSVSGYLVLSDKPVAMMSGQQHRQISGGSTSQEATVVQVQPIRLLSQAYLVVTTERYYGYQVVAVHDNTEVYSNNGTTNTLVTTLNAGQSYQSYQDLNSTPALLHGSPFVISVSKPAYVYNIGTNSIGEFEIFQAPPVDRPVGKASKVVYSSTGGNIGWVIVDAADASKLKRNGSATLGNSHSWTFNNGGYNKRVYYWGAATAATGFSPSATNNITCDNCNSMYVGQMRDNGSSGAQIGYISSFDVQTIQFYNTNQLPDKLLTYGYTIRTVDYSPPVVNTVLNHTLTEASSAGGLRITSISLKRTSGSTQVGSVVSFLGLNFTLNLPARSTVTADDVLEVFITTTDNAGNVASLCMNVLLSRTLTTVPVTLLSFTAAKNNNSSLLNWKTATEQNNKGFVIERSADGYNWVPIGFVNSRALNGNSDQELAYVYEDNQPLDGKNYYQLKQVDLDGKYAYSPVRIVDFSGAGSQLKVFPNPVANTLFINGLKGHNTIQLRNTTGQLLRTEISRSETVKTIDMTAFPKGMYIVSITDESGHAKTYKLVKE